MVHITEKEIERFWGKVDIGSESQCWPWIAKARHWKGYGVMRISSMGRNIVASRISCILAHGLPPEGLHNALHSCDNPPCCNPNHLRWGTQKQNAQDAIERGRASKPPVNYPGRHTGKMPKGVNVSHSVLTDEKVKEIFRLFVDEGMTVKDIAVAVGVKHSPVYHVCSGTAWRHVEGAPDAKFLRELLTQRSKHRR